MDVGVVGIIADVGANACEALTVDIDPRSAGRMPRLAHDVGAVVNAVEIDRFAVVVRPRPVGRWGETDHRRQRRPAIDMRHHLAVVCACRNVARPPHDTGHTETALERRTFLTAERHRTGVWPCILPRAIVGGDDDDGVGSLGPDGALRLLGEPNPKLSRPPLDVRFGSRGSTAVNYKDGKWFDHENQVGGGVLDLISKKIGRSKSEALEWLKEQGFYAGAASHQSSRTPGSIGLDNFGATSLKTKEHKMRMVGPGVLPPHKQINSFLEGEGQ